MRRDRQNRRVANILAILLFLLPLAGAVRVNTVTWAGDAVHIAFQSSGVPAHPYLMGTYGGDSSYFLCMNSGGSAHSNYEYYKVDADVDYWEGSIEQKRLFWAYILGFGSFDKDQSLNQVFGSAGRQLARDVSWDKGAHPVSSLSGSWEAAHMEELAQDGFLSLKDIPAGCKSPEEIYHLISRYDSPQNAMWTGSLYGSAGPGSIDGEKLYELCGISDWKTFMRYCTIRCINNPEVAVTMNPDEPMITYTIPVYEVGAMRDLVFEVSYDPSVFRVCKVTGALEFFRCQVQGSQQLYRARGKVEETGCKFYLSTAYNPDAPVSPGGSGPSPAPSDLTVELYEHQETFRSHYRVALDKKDYETGYPLQGSSWQVLEKFDDSQLDSSEEGLLSGEGSGLREENMREPPAVWKEWLVFEDDLLTDGAGHLEHADERYYEFCHQYCDGHPLPPEPEGEEEDEGDEEEEYEELMRQWQAAVDACRAKAEAGQGTFHHWECGAESRPSIEEAFEQSGCREARDNAYRNFIHLEYSYTFRETNARDGYILHGPAGHPDDVPVEIITTASSEAGVPARWTAAGQEEMIVTGYVRNRIPGEEETEAKRSGRPRGAEVATPSQAALETLSLEPERTPLSKRLLNGLARLFGLPEPFARAQGLTIRVRARDAATPSDLELATASDSVEEELVYLSTDSDALEADGSRYRYEPKGTPALLRGIRAADASEEAGINLDHATPDGQPEVSIGPDGETAHCFVIYDHRVPGELHFNKRDLELAAGEKEGGYDAYGDAQGDGTMEGAVYGLFAADDIYGPDTQRAADGTVTAGTGIIFDANDLVAVAATDRNGDGSFMTITERPHSMYDSRTGQIRYSGKPYPANLYRLDGWVKEKPEEEYGRVYTDNETANGCCWIGRPLILGNYYIKELTRSEGYEWSVTGKELEHSNVTDDTADGYGETPDAAANPVGEAWITGQLRHAVTVPEGNEAYGNRENLLSLEVAIRGAEKGFSVIFEGLPEQAEFYLNEMELKPVTIRIPDGGAWEDAAQEPLYETASGCIFKRDIHGNRIEDRDAVPSPIPLTKTAARVKELAPGKDAQPSDARRYDQEFTTEDENLRYVKYELEQMLRTLGVDTPRADGSYSTEARPVYDNPQSGAAAFGMPTAVLEISQITTNRSVVEAILDYYVEKGVFTYGGLQSASLEGDSAHVVILTGALPIRELLYRENADGEVTNVYLYRLNERYGRYILREYTGSEILGAFEMAGNLGHKRITVSPDFQVDDDGTVTDRIGYRSDLEHYLSYRGGELLYDYWQQDRDGNWTGHEPVRRKVYVPVFREEQIQEEQATASRVARVGSPKEAADPAGSTYVYRDRQSGQEILHVGTADCKGGGSETYSFTVALPDGKTAVTRQDMARIGVHNVWGYQEGDRLGSAEYAVRVRGAGAGVSTSEEFDRNTSYLANCHLVYRGNHDLREDGGTASLPCRVEERAITQKIKIRKEIRTREDGSYDGDTYSNAHADNLSEDIWGRWQKKEPDWLWEKVKRGGTSSLGGFRFKAYLKSNLERLYRDADGTVTWLDRNGNPVNILEQKEAFPREVQKIYTKVPHTGEVVKDSNRAVKAAWQLYGWTGGQIDSVPNAGYTAVLEEKLTGNGRRGTSRYGTNYNYEKFFDALRTANLDRWDNPANRNREFTTWEEWDAVRNAWEGILDGSTPDTSYKPFARILAGRYSASGDSAGCYPAIHDNKEQKNECSTGEEAKKNAKSSDAVRQFAITWYLDHEVDKLAAELEDGEVRYSDEIYDKALYEAIRKANHYLTPFFRYDLDTVYSVEWDEEADGGEDRDKTTVCADTAEVLPVNGYYGVSRYLPYGTYVVVEQQPDAFPQTHYRLDAPKEIALPSVYEPGEPGTLARACRYRGNETPEELASRFRIRFNEEWAENHTDDLNEYVIAAHNADGDFEVYKYGMELGKLSELAASGENRGWKETQDVYDPIRDAYNDPVVCTKEAGGNPDSHYYADDGGRAALSGPERYPCDEIERRYHYASVSEVSGTENGVRMMTGEQTAFAGEYAPMLVPWSVREPVLPDRPGRTAQFGYAEETFHNTFYTARLRIEKLDGETGEPILHDQAIFAVYGAVRDDSGHVRFYEKPTVIAGSREFLEAMGAANLYTKARPIPDPDMGENAVWYGTVPAGTPVCLEEEQVVMENQAGNRTGKFWAFTTKRDGELKKESGQGVVTADQNTGYLETPLPLGAGVYVLAEIKPPAGYVRSRPMAVEVYSDRVVYCQNGSRDRRVAAAIYESSARNGDGEEKARVYVENTPTRLEIAKKKTDAEEITYRVSGRVEGSISELAQQYGLENLELAYHASGTYLGYGWKKGTAEALEARKAAGEQIEFLYEKGVFSGAAEVTRPLLTAGDTNRYVKGAVLTLYDAIPVERNGDSQDYAFRGVTVERDRSSHVTRMYVKRGYAGSQVEFVRQADGSWGYQAVPRPDTDILFFDLGGLRVFETGANGERYSFDKNGKRMRIVDGVTGSIYALRGGKPEFEITGGDFDRLEYRADARAFTRTGEAAVIYHLDADGVRDAVTDPYTGMAYVTETPGRCLVWPVEVVKDRYGNLLAKNKLRTSRVASFHADTPQEYIGGTYDGAGGGSFKKKLSPILDVHGQTVYYRRSEETYQKSVPVYDRDQDFLYDRYSSHLERFNEDAYLIKDHDSIFDKGVLWDESDNRDEKLYMRRGDHYILENTWVSGESTPNDPFDSGENGGKGRADLLKRVIPGTYILEELKPPEGYAKGFPVGMTVAETGELQSAELTNETIKVEIAKIDAPADLRLPEDGRETGLSYTYQPVPGASLALFRARKVYTTDLETHPKGWYLEKTEQQPAAWSVQGRPYTAQWITGSRPQYLEGVPAGAYLLEELRAPSGYVRASAELIVKPVGEVQTFQVENDHTRLELLKYRTLDGKKEAMPNAHAAGLSLYAAALQEDGSPVMQEGQPVYDPERLIESWTTDDCRRYTSLVDLASFQKWGILKRIRSRLGLGGKRYSGFEHDYEEMYRTYGTGFDELHWFYTDGTPNLREEAAFLTESQEADRTGCVRQTWETGDGRQIRITISPDRDPFTGAAGRFAYQYNFRRLEENMVSYDTSGGAHRIDYIPFDGTKNGAGAAAYVLVETGTPEGYVPAAPKLILVRETAQIQMYEMENKPVPVSPEQLPESSTEQPPESSTETPPESKPETPGQEETTTAWESPQETRPTPAQTEPAKPDRPHGEEGEETTKKIIPETQEETSRYGRITTGYYGGRRTKDGSLLRPFWRLSRMGDHSLAWLWLVLLMISGAGILIIRRRNDGKTHKEQEKEGGARQEDKNHSDGALGAGCPDPDERGQMPGGEGGGES